MINLRKKKITETRYFPYKLTCAYQKYVEAL